MKPLISFIAITYNAGLFIGNLIESVATQTVDFELIIVDDESSDNTAGICKEYAKKYDFIKFFTKNHAGAGAARNYGINKATGEFTVFIDADDMIVNNIFNENTAKLLNGYKDDGTDLVFTPKLTVDFYLDGDVVKMEPEAFDEIQNHIPKLEFWSYIYKTRFLQENNIVFPEYALQDIETAFRFRAYAQSGKTVINNELPFYIQRVNPLSISQNYNYYNLYCIKALVQYDILQDKFNGANYENADLVFTLRQFYNFALKFYDCVIVNGKNYKNELKPLVKLLGKRMNGIKEPLKNLILTYRKILKKNLPIYAIE